MITRGSLAFGWSATDLLFSDESEAAFDKWALVYSTDFVLGTVTFTSSAGALLGGSLDFTGRAPTDLDVGWLLALGVSWRVLEDRGYAPYIVLNTTLSGLGSRVLGASGYRASYHGVDARFGATVGKTFGQTLSPYLSLRVFGGPVWIDDTKGSIVGTDQYHLQPAVGAVLLLPGGIDMFVDVAPVLERSVLGGIGLVY